MPGLYINDGGQASSALGNILGGIAASVGPKGMAEAELLRQQTEGADLANKLKGATLQGVLGIPATTAAMSADPTAAAAPGGVAGTLAGAAVPPDPATPFARNYTAGFSPFNQVLAGSYANDPSMANFGAGVNLGRTAALGPGHDYGTQTDVAKANMLPYDLTAGTERHFPTNLGLGGAAGQTVTPATDPAQLEAQKAQLASAQKEADTRAAIAETATNTQGDLIQAKQLYNSLVGATDVGSVLTPAVLGWISTRTGIPVEQLNQPEMAKRAIRQILKSSVGNSLQAVQADPTSAPIRGALQQVNDSIPDPDAMNDAQFNAGIDRMLKITARQQEQGGPARVFKTSAHGKADADAMYQGLEAIRARQEAENQKELAAGGAGAGGGQIHVYSSQAEVDADIAAGELHEGDKIRIGRGPKAITGTVGHVK